MQAKEHKDVNHKESDVTLVRAMESVTFAYGDVAVLQKLSWSVPAGLSLVQGGDGAGKTTVLRLLAGELQPQAGRVRWVGTELPAVFWHDPRALWPEDIVVAAWLEAQARQWPRWDGPAAQAHVDGLGLAAHLHKRVSQLSTGTLRKMLMVGALASFAPLSLVDEPLAGLDAPSIRYLRQALAAGAPAWRAQACAVVLAHYDCLEGVHWDSVLALAD